MKSYKCDSCGAEFVINNDSSYTECIYCGSSIVVIRKEYEELNIKKILPFCLSHEEVIEQLLCLGLIDMKGDIMSIKGIFVPAYHYFSEFDYLINSNVYVHISDKTVNYSVQDLVYGTVKEKIISPFKSRSSDVVGWGLFYSGEFLDFDPVLVEDHSLEYCEIDALIESAKEEIIYRCRNVALSQYSKEGFYYENSSSENLIVSDMKFDDYTTLLPIYVVKLRSGKKIYVNGNKTNIEKIKSGKIFDTVINLSLVLIIAAYLFFLNFLNSIFNNLASPILFTIFIVLLVIKICKSDYRYLDNLSDSQKFSLGIKRLGEEKELE